MVQRMCVALFLYQVIGFVCLIDSNGYNNKKQSYYG